MPGAMIPKSQFDSIADAIEAFRNGEFLVVLDDPGRENEADLIIAAQDVSPAQMAFMIRHSSGFVCAPITVDRADTLALPPMVDPSATQDPRGTAYTLSVDAADASVTTGISAADRALACHVLADPSATRHQLRRPGHVLPLRAHPGGIRARPGHTEAAIELCRLAGKQPAAAICELVDDGHEVPGQAVREGAGMLRGDDCIAFARKWGLRVCTIADMVDHLQRADIACHVNGSCK